jgi:predicted dithiol-disulfide oxidoreductase (DUF899 family)
MPEERSKRFPGESAEYRRARNRLLRAEVRLRRQTEAVAALRRALPLGGAVKTDYEFDVAGPGDGEARRVRLSQLFGQGQRTLFVYNFMFPKEPGSMLPCPSCTSIIDAVDGAARHVTQRIGFAVVAKAPIEMFREHARRRGWRHALLLSSAGNDFNRDYLAEDVTSGHQWPLAHVFVRRGKKIHHSWSSELWFAKSDPGQDMRHVDFMWPVWSILDCTPEGRGKTWGPEIEYS